MAKIVTAMLVVWTALGLVLVTALAFRSDSPTDGDRVVVAGERTAMAAPSSTGVPAGHTDGHARMTSQMRVSSPDASMLSQMADDPMWQMMYHPGHVRAEEEYQRQMDQMLAAAGTP